MRTRARADQVVAFVRYRGAVGAASPRPSSLWGEGELQTFAAIMRFAYAKLAKPQSARAGVTHLARQVRRDEVRVGISSGAGRARAPRKRRGTPWSAGAVHPGRPAVVRW